DARHEARSVDVDFDQRRAGSVVEYGADRALDLVAYAQALWPVWGEDQVTRQDLQPHDNPRGQLRLRRGDDTASEADPRETRARIDRFDAPVDDRADQLWTYHRAQCRERRDAGDLALREDATFLEQHDVACETDDVLEVMAHIDDRQRMPVAKPLEPRQQL